MAAEPPANSAGYCSLFLNTTTNKYTLVFASYQIQSGYGTYQWSESLAGGVNWALGNVPWVAESNDITQCIIHDSFALPSGPAIGLFSFLDNVSTIQNLTYLDTSNVTSMSWMFSMSGFTSLDLSHFNTTNVTDMSHMFEASPHLTSLDLRSFSTSSVTNMNSMFCDTGLTGVLDLSNFMTEKVTDMYRMFYRCRNLTCIYARDYWFKTSQVTGSNQMFDGCTSLIGGNGTTYNSSYIDKTYARADLFGIPGYFTSAGVYASVWNRNGDDNDQILVLASNAFDSLFLPSGYSGTMADDCHQYDWSDMPIHQWTLYTGEITEILVINDIYPMILDGYFDGMSNLTTLTGFEKIHTDLTNDFVDMFNDCSSITSIDISNFELKRDDIESDRMFQNCTSLTTIYGSDNFNTIKITSSSDMFNGCTSLVGGNGTTYNSNYIDKTYARIDKSGTPGYFTTVSLPIVFNGNVVNGIYFNGTQVNGVYFNGTKIC